MPRYVEAEAFNGDWLNNGRGRKLKCPSCGSEFRAYVAIKSATCPRGHRMKILTADAVAAERMRCAA